MKRLLFISMTFELTVLCLSSSLLCDGELCPKVISMPLVDNMKASLKADIDVSQINKYLKAYIKQEINTEIRTIMKDVVEELTENRTSSMKEENVSRQEGKRLNESCSTARECKETLICENRYCQCRGTEHWNGMQCLGNSKGVQFTIVFTEKGYVKETKLLVASKKGGLLSQYTFFNNRNKTTRFTNTQYSLDPLDNNVIKDGIEKVGIEVQSSIPISLYGIQDRDNGGSTEAYMAIPRKYLSTNYLLPSFKVYSSAADSALTITTTEDSTTVKLNLRMEKGPLRYKNRNYNNNDEIILVLNKFHSFKLSHSSDLSGTTIQATKPVSVLTSSKENKVTKTGGNNELLEMVLPLNQIDHFYVIPEIVTRPSSTVRVYCPEETTLSLYDGNNRLTKHVDGRKFIDFTHRKISYIHGNHDFLVMIFPHELPDGTGTTFMMTIHGVNQYMSNYDFAVPAIDDLKSHVTVCVKSSALGGFTLDGQPTTIDGVYSISNGTDRYSTFSFKISPGQHNISHTGGARFGLWVYGENNAYDAYGYPAGIAFKTNI
ncbi:unnamed protein product [Mytilus coruscus]|uniref:IgGFc-binding protein N-terminal domain-containing protein n=1 Tax=Mytilus coruscus TaxID=42192 RepID=A0A6J8BTV4_MYTCO|nr:unnamed protein product [Mytilus coruscus]